MSGTQLVVLWGLEAEQSSQREHFHPPDGLERTLPGECKRKERNGTEHLPLQVRPMSTASA